MHCEISRCPADSSTPPHLPGAGAGVRGDGDLAGHPGHLSAGREAPGAAHAAPPPPRLVLADVDVEVD